MRYRARVIMTGMSRKLWILTGCAAVVAVIVLAQIRRAPRQTEDRVTLKSSGGGFSLSPQAAVQKMPAWIPVYAGAAPEGIYSADTSEESRHTYSFKSADAPAKVAAFFEERMSVNGFTVTPQMSEDQGGILTGFTADKKKQVVVTIARAGGVTQVSVMAVEKK